VHCGPHRRQHRWGLASLLIAGKRIVGLEGLEAFGEAVYDFLVMAIERQYPLSTETFTAAEKAAVPHAFYSHVRTQIVLGFESQVPRYALLTSDCHGNGLCDQAPPHARAGVGV
jgi:hypothetical protein